MDKIVISIIISLIGGALLSYNAEVTIVVLLIIVFSFCMYKYYIVKKLFNKSDLLKPIHMFSIYFIFYYFIGTINISEYRGIIHWKSISIIIMGYLIFIAGSYIGLCFKYKKKVSRYNYSLIVVMLNVIILISILSCIIITYQTRSILLFNQARRFLIGPSYLYLLELVGIVPLFVISFSKYFANKLSLREKLIYLLLPIFLLSLSGYRGIPIAVIVECGLLYYKFLKPEKRRRALLIIVAFAVAINYFGFNIRRLPNSDLIETKKLVSNVKLNPTLIIIAPMHFSFRETIGLTQNIIEKFPIRYEYLHGKLLISDIATLLPGFQKSGPEIVNNYIVKDHKKAALTPSIFGAFYMDFGKMGVIFGCLILGIIAGYFYKRYSIQNDPQSLMNLVYVYIYMLHFIHRGIFKPSYLFFFIIINVIFMIARKRYRTTEYA